MKTWHCRDGQVMRTRTLRRSTLQNARNLVLQETGGKLDRWLLMVDALRRTAAEDKDEPPNERALKSCGMQRLQGLLRQVGPATSECGKTVGCRVCLPTWGVGSGAIRAAPIQHLAKEKVMNAEVIIKGLDRIENSIGETSNTVRGHSERLLMLEQRGGSALAIEGSAARPGASGNLADKVFQELQKNADLLSKTRSLRLEIKAAGDPITTGSGRTIVSGGAGAPSGAVLGIQNGLPQRPASGTTAIEYSRFTGTQGAAAQQATEGTAKAAVRPDHTIVTQTAITIAGYTKISRQSMNDAAEVKAAIEITLRRSVNTALDVALVNGATGFAGGLEGLATAYTSLIYTGMVDAISEGVSAMQVAGFAPDMVALNPADWLAITVAKGSDGHYLSGAYLGEMPMASRGLRVVLSPSVDAGKALLMDSSHTEVAIVDGFAVEIAYDTDDFTKNLATMLGELRVIPVFRTMGSARLITPKA